MAADTVDALLALESALLKVPFEQLTKVFRNAQKIVERELQTVLGNVDELAKRAVTTPAAAREAAAALGTQLARVQHLQRRLADINAEEQQCVDRMELRLSELEKMAEAEESGTKEAQRVYHRARFERIVIDYMLREGFYESALALATDSKLQAMVDVDLFMSCRKIEEALRQHSCSECLQWCNENRAKLRKTKSSLEFQMRLQEYIELVRASKLPQAIAHVRKHLVPFMDTHAPDIQRAMALLAFSDPATKCGRYQKLYSAQRWDDLIAQFRTDHFALYALSAQSLLSVTLQAGLSALKTPMCSEPADHAPNCPVCSSVMGQLAEGLPSSHHTQSLIVCRATGAIMDADNPPYMLPNCNVYSLAAINTATTSKGTVIDPRTGEEFALGEIRKVFVS